MGATNLSSSQRREHLAAVTAHAVKAVTGLMQAAGPGEHLITAAVQTPNAEPVIAYAWFDIVGEGTDARWSGVYADAAAVAEAVTVAFILAKGSIVLGTTSPTGEESVRAWTVDDHTLRPLTAEQVRHAFHETIGPKSAAVTYQTAFRIPSASPV
ncbi:hypothetical protein ACGFZU_43605 [Streptomyces tendae]|uniref:hypothetical protein n=1 Tax=Streptomyces tendae TaxID=1932 RepID=UPI003717DB84